MNGVIMIHHETNKNRRSFWAMLETGKIYEGKVKGITNYGAFVEVEQEGERPITGMVHISEVANTYVNDIREHLTEGQDVKVIVLQINEQNKISMSIKKALPQEEKPQQYRAQRRPNNQNYNRNTYRENRAQPAAEPSFEDMMSRFKQRSEERMGDIKRNTDRKNKSRRRSR